LCLCLPDKLMLPGFEPQIVLTLRDYEMVEVVHHDSFQANDLFSSM
jgi:hypothetical protein